jgi:hypothetical protein
MLIERVQTTNAKRIIWNRDNRAYNQDTVQVTTIPSVATYY